MTAPRKATLKLPSKSVAKGGAGEARKLSPRASRAQVVRGVKPMAPVPAAKVTSAPAARPVAKMAPRSPVKARDPQAGNAARGPGPTVRSGPRPATTSGPRSATTSGPRPATQSRPAPDAPAKAMARPPARSEHDPKSNPKSRFEDKPPRPRLPPARVSAPDSAPAPVRIAALPARSAEPAGPIRLSKRMSEVGLASRREADEWIERGWVRIDGELAVLGSKWLPGQEISVDKRARKEQDRRLTVLLHKPMGYVSGQAEDGHQPASVLVLPETQWAPPAMKSKMEGLIDRKDLLGLAPAGRLDIDSTGLLILTQDGRIAKQLIGEDSDVEKEYLVRVKYTRGDQLPEADLRLLQYGLSLDDKKLKPARVGWQNEDQLRFILKEGKKRQIRRMCEAVGLEVLALKRVRIGSVRLGELPVGKWRLLGPDEKFA